MRITKASAAVATRQADWIVTIEPWRGLGYAPERLGRWLGRRSRQGGVKIARTPGAATEIAGIIVVQPEVLLGQFIALLAVSPAAAGQGIGRALVEDAARDAARTGRWLYTSSDADNRGAAAFYRKLGFARVGRLPDLVRAGRVEILWRRAVRP